jgi:hypothetical protein
MPRSPRGDRYSTPAQYEARNIANRALKHGLLKAQPCEVCSKLPAECHHDDYDRPLQVRWLCKRHHLDWHNIFTPKNRQATE